MMDWVTATAGSLKGRVRHAGRGSVWLAAAVLLCAALLLRLPGYGDRPLWLDELWRVNLILDPAFWHDYFLAPSVGSAITSLAYALFVKCVGLLGAGPDLLRLSSLIPGLLAVLMAFFLTRRAGGGVALALLAGLIFALNRSFISYSKEMKPYAFELFVHMANLYAWWVVLQVSRPSIRTWLLYFFTLLFTVFSTPTVIFVLPAAGLTLFARILTDGTDKKARNKNLAICTALFTVIGIVVTALYYFVWRHGSTGDMLSIWAEGFSQSGNYLRFLKSALIQMWRQGFDTMVAVRMQAELALAALAAVFVWALIKRKTLQEPARYLLVFYLVLGATVCLLNFVKIWPLGPLRVNLFLYGYLVMLLFMLAAQLPFQGVAARLCLLGGCFFVLWPLHSAASPVYYRNIAETLRTLGAPVERNDSVMEDFSTDGPVGRAILAECSRQKTLVIADGYMSAAVEYYTKHDPAHRQGAALLEGSCVRYAKYSEAYLYPADADTAISKLLPGAGRVWFIHSHLASSDLVPLQRIVERYGHITHVKNYQGAGYFELVLPQRNPASQSQTPAPARHQ